MKTKSLVNTTTTLTLTILVLLFSLTSCKKTTVGPQGEQGVQGAQGIQGETGNANVKSVVFSSTCEWKADSTNGTYTFRYYTTLLDQAALMKGAIMMYDGNNCGCEWKAMPMREKNLQTNFTVELSSVEVVISTLDGKMPCLPGVHKYKLVIIPPAK